MLSFLMTVFIICLGNTLLISCGGKKKEPAVKSEASKSAVGAAPASVQGEPTPDAEKKAE